jgi:RimJ/RimL family protein N-acetyltransferase
MIRSERLVGAPLDDRDFDDLCTLHADERVVAAFHTDPLTVEDTRAFLDEKLAHWRAHGFGIWVFRDANGSFVGRCGLRHRVLEGEDEIDLGYIVSPELWSQGYATEMGRAVIDQAFGALGFTGLIGTTWHDNAASQRVLEKLGFVHERPIDAGLGVLYRLRAPDRP